MNRADQLTCPDCTFVTNASTPRRAEQALRTHQKSHTEGFGARGAQHGTRSGFVLHHRRGEDPCQPCEAAAQEYHNAYWHNHRRFIEGTPHVPTTRVVEHLAALRASGMGVRRISQLSGVSPSTIAKLPDNRLGMRPQTARRLLAVKPSTYLRALVPAQRRCQALAAIGWDARRVAERSGLRMRVISDITAGRMQQVSEPTDVAVRRTYEMLCMTPGPSQRARNWARSRGWAPPLAWDDIDRDAYPAMPDEPVTRLEEAQWLAETGETFEAAATRLNLSREGLENYLRRHDGGVEVLHQLQRNRRPA